MTIYEGVDANAPISVPNPNWLGAAFERTPQYDSHYGWVKAQYQGPKVANYSHDTRAKAGAYTQVWRHDRYGHVVKEGAPWDDAAGVMGRQITALDAWSQATQAQLGNGLHTGRTTLLTTGQLTGICVGAGPGQCGTLDLDYAYDGWGNVTSHTQGAPLATESFGYDKLHRLTSSQRNGSAAVTLGYHPNGNLKYKSDYSVASESAYQYGSKPHAVTQVTGLNNLKRCYTYDGAGNQLTHKTGPTCTAIERTMTYEIGHRPETIQGGSAYGNERVLFRYGSDGERYIQRQQPFNQPAQDTKVTLYPFPGYEVEVAKQGSSWTPVEGRQRLGEWGLWRAGTLIPQGTRVYWHGDRLGSPAAKSGSAGELIERHGFDAWGAGRNDNWTPKPYGRLGSTQSPRGFTGHEHLDAMGGLIHMNGRGYDPNLGRFLSVDPIIQAPANSQSFNPYSYIMNNPLAGTDPTGYCAEGTLEGDKLSCRFTPVGSRISKEISGTVQSDGSVQWDSSSVTVGGKLVSGNSFLEVRVQSNGSVRSNEVSHQGDRVVRQEKLMALDNRTNNGGTFGSQTEMLRDETSTPENMGVVFDYAVDDDMRAYMGWQKSASGRVEPFFGLEEWLLGGGQAKALGGFKSWILGGAASKRAPSLDDLSRAASAPARGGFTQAGRSLQKHGSRPGSRWNQADIDVNFPRAANARGQYIVDDVLTSPGTKIVPNPRGGWDAISPDGRTVRFNRDGSFQGLRE